MSIMTNAENAVAAEREGYERGVRDCLKLLSKWFFMTTIDARKCRDEMRALIPPGET